MLTGPRAAAAPRGEGAPQAPTGMLTDLLPQGLGATAGQRPRFSRQVPDAGPGNLQHAYRLQLAATPDGFDKGRLVWDSGKVDSAASTAVAYDGPALKPRTAYWWRVSSWAGQRSPWSEPVLMATSVEDEWTAEPIRAPAGPTMADGRRLVDHGREIVGGLALELTGSAGDTVEVRLGEEGGNVTTGPSRRLFR
ncbi:hypothetical protein GCM10010129_00860 [Streptomyces fumigatiscleroticus]|nr:hypothetical protein GCM10010129_00860 [Streptomyces fumigatiscleroticus]